MVRQLKIPMQEEENTPEDVIPTEAPAADTPTPDTPFRFRHFFEALRKLPQGCGRQLTATGIF